MKWEDVEHLQDGYFKRIVGIKRETFNKILDLLKIKYAEKHAKGGRKSKLSVENILLATLDYLREYRTLDHLAVSYHIHVSNLHRNITWCEDEMIKLDMFSLPGMKALRDDRYKEVTIDVTECIIERPVKGQKTYYSGKKNDTP